METRDQLSKNMFDHRTPKNLQLAVLSRGGRGFGPNCAVDCADVNKTYPTNYNSMGEKTELIKHRMLSVAS